MTLDINTDEYLSLMTPDVGVRLVIHHPNTVPFPEDEGVNLLPAFISSIGVTKVSYLCFRVTKVNH